MTRLRLAYPFTVIRDGGAVRLVAGEDFRYTLEGDGVERWLPDLLARLDGRRSVEEACAALDEPDRLAARETIDRLRGERVLVEGTAADAHAPATGAGVRVLVQDRLDWDEALRFNRRALDEAAPWLWASTGPAARAYIGPLFLPDAGPCFACLLRRFRDLSPAPEIYDALVAQARAGRPIEPAPFPAEAVEVVRGLVRWKEALAARPEAPAALYRLHVVEVATLEVSAHAVAADPECAECAPRRS